ncbi:hypothetical protein ES332_A03G154000v1 [Gossypium tomentosum]|uniref:Leucine-rich repeat-containing N-terminal plant-type domain-containing protein n=1 Tax=Gossypium tomentosum TaxID=34277 RepID=A0A5D2R7Q7_GOSTO|nr:hypothetical protein ES332_A03G154000v1 [Gossypium tomentosum]
MHCLNSEKGLKDPSVWLSSWAGKDCCNWTGVNYSNMTGNIIMLYLKTMDYCGSVGHSEALNIATCLSGTLSPSLLNLTYLSYLDLNGNNFERIPIPKFIGSLKTLRLLHLDLSRASFIGEVPHSLGNLSYLEYLSLSKDLSWVVGLFSLQYLDLSFMNLSKENNWVKAINMLHSLTTLDLSWYELQDFIESFRIKFTSLSVLDLSYNNFNSTIPCWLLNITTLQRVYLQRSEFKGSLPKVSRGSLYALGGCSNNTLGYLDFSSNNLQGKLPNSLGNLKYLIFLRLFQNSFSGSLPWAILESSRQLTRIAIFNLYGNSWEGTITENHFLNLSKLVVFVTVLFNLNPDWVPSFSLYETAISNFQLGLRFPTWLRTQVDAFEIILSSADISDIILVWFWYLTFGLQWVDLSNNQLKESFPPNVTHLSLRNNLFSGPNPSSIGLRMSKVGDLDLSRNFLNGSILASINEMETLSFLDLLSNCLSRTIPRNLQGLRKLVILDLSENNLSGVVSSSFCALPSLIFLKLSSNNLSGELSSVSQNFSREFCEHVEIVSKGRKSEYKKIIPLLNVIDLSANDLKGEIPDHITKLSVLFTLNLSWNHLSGKISENIGNLQLLESLDLSYNNLSSPIPASMISMTFLNYLNLCSPPTNRDGEDENGDSKGEDEKFGFYISMGVGLAIGFLGCLLAYFKFIDEMKNKVYVFIAVMIAHYEEKI